MRPPTSSLSLAIVLVLALAAAGCGSNTNTGAAAGPVKAATVKKPLSPADQLSPNLVPAVQTGKAGAGLLQIKFELAGPPAVGDPVDVDLVVLPTADNLDEITGTVQGDDGLDVVAGGTIDPMEKPTFGNPVHHSLKVVARRDGIFAMTASMAVHTGGQVMNPVFTMPVIGGNGFGDAAAAPAAAKPAPAPAAH
jgi:hypothetical protein